MRIVLLSASMILLLILSSCTYKRVPKDLRPEVKHKLRLLIASDQKYRSMMAKHSPTASDTLEFDDINMFEIGKIKKVKRQRFIPKSIMNELIIRQKTIDSLNFEMLVDIINKYGFPGIKQVGLVNYRMGTSLVILHYLDPYQQEILIPLLKKECLEGNLKGKDYALFVDKACLVNGAPGIYGSPFTPPSQCFESLTKTNQLRREIRLKPIKDLSKQCD